MTLFTSSFLKVSIFSPIQIETKRCEKFPLLKPFSKGSVFSCVFDRFSMENRPKKYSFSNENVMQ